jgi:ketosteroid isomerase-like protein
MSHPNEDLLRAAYTAFIVGDLEGYLRYCSDDIAFHVPGRNPVSGVYSRAQFVTPFISRVMELCGGTFRETVLDVVANDRRGVVLAEHEFQRKGKTHAYRTVHMYRIDNGKLTDFREYPEDVYAFDEAWA